MGDLLIRDVPEAMKAELAKRARESGRSLSEEAKMRIRKSLLAKDEEPRKFANAYEAIRSAFVENGAVDDEYAKVMDEVEAERKRDFGRPLPDFE